MAADDTAAGPITATGTTSPNINGQAIAITVFSTLKWWGRIWLPILFLALRVRPKSLGALKHLSFIHFARWTIVRSIPFNESPQVRERLRYPHLYFESNFNGGWEEYIDAFSYILTFGMSAFWKSSYGFPTALPAGPFKLYIKRNEIDASYFYSAYPEATTSMVRAALELEPKVAALGSRAGSMTPEAFGTAWREFIRDIQRCL